MIVTRYSMRCDTCDAVYVPPVHLETSAIATRVAAREQEGWVLVDLLDLCPSCELARRRKGGVA